MARDISIVIADTNCMPAIRESASLPGRIMSFPAASLGSALESVRAYRPRVVAIDAVVAQTPSGVAFMDRVEQVAIQGSTILLLVEHDGRWVTMRRGSAESLTQSRWAGATALKAPPPAPSNQMMAAASNVVRAAAPAQVASTRRVPRFPVHDALDVAVESGSAHLVDISILGAQIVSLPVLRPGQKIKIGLRDTDDTLTVIAQVAWSTFEKTQLRADAHYRVGLEFTNGAKDALEQYRQRHCTEQSIPRRR